MQPDSGELARDAWPEFLGSDWLVLRTVVPNDHTFLQYH